VASHIETVGIVGAGAMGAGIAQVALEAGHAVTICDPDPTARRRAFERIQDGLARRGAKSGRPSAWVDDTMSRLRVASSPETVAAGADLVIEAAIEDLAAKQTIFSTISAAAPAHAILATNTSALSVAAIGASTTCPERIIGLHFFNPAPVMRLVEVVATAAADPAVVSTAMDLMSAWGKTPVRCADSPGFIVNRVNRPFTIEALRMLSAGDGTIAGIDGAMRESGFPMGPFELMDLVGIDVNLAAARAIWEGLGRPDRMRPSPIQEHLVEAGHLGRKTGTGFYRYDKAGRPMGPAEIQGDFGAVTPGARLTNEEIATRIRDAIDDEARLAAATAVATADDITLALRLGAGHPPRATPRTIRI
jgi:3-hydroxybutyryl-CoA dehydrogenase